MALNIPPIQQKKKHTGFFVLLAIIAVLTFSAYALTKKQRNDTGVPGLTTNEREAMAEAFKNNQEAELTQTEKNDLVKSMSGAKEVKPLTQQEKEAISKQFEN
jgi:hypothetical protein